MKEKKSNLPILFLIIAIIIIIIMGLFIYKLYNDKMSMSNSIEELNDKINKIGEADVQEESQNKNEEQDKLETLNTDSDLVKKLYDYVAKFSYYDELIAYQSEKVTEKNMNNSLKLLTVFNNLGENDATRVEYKYESEEIPKREHIIYAKDVVENKAKEIFGKDVKIVHQDASPYDSHTIKYENGEYDSYDYEGGGSVPWENSINFLISAEKDNTGTIYIYDKYVHLVEVDNIKEDGTNMAGSYDIYTSSDKKEKLASKVDFNEKNIYPDADNIDVESVQWNKTYIQNIEKYLGKELTTYKHTYKQNSDGTYYWYSTEPMK